MTEDTMTEMDERAFNLAVEAYERETLGMKPRLCNGNALAAAITIYLANTRATPAPVADKAVQELLARMDAWVLAATMPGAFILSQAVTAIRALVVERDALAESCSDLREQRERAIDDLVATEAERDRLAQDLYNLFELKWGTPTNLMGKYADHLLALGWTLAPRAAVPEGWKLVPINPTKAMTDAAGTLGLDRPCDIGAHYLSDTEAADTWIEMLAAAPTPPKETKP